MDVILVQTSFLDDSMEVIDFMEYGRQEVARREASGKFSSAHHLDRALEYLCRFLQGRRLPINEVDGPLVSDWRDFLQGCGLGLGTVRLYVNVLRGVYNRAVRQRMVADSFPFGSLGLCSPAKPQPVLSEDEMARFVSLEVSPCGWQWLTHRFCCLIYHLCGMPPVDLMRLRWSQVDLRRGVLTYSRHKTGNGSVIPITAEAKTILLELRRLYERRHELGDRGWGRLKCVRGWQEGYVFPFIADATDGKATYLEVKNAERMMNGCLKRLGERLGVSGLSLYAFRRSWATTAHSVYKADMGDISRGLCHASVRTTYLYIQRADLGSFHLLAVRMSKGLGRRARQLVTKPPGSPPRGRGKKNIPLFL